MIELLENYKQDIKSIIETSTTKKLTDENIEYAYDEERYDAYEYAYCYGLTSK